MLVGTGINQRRVGFIAAGVIIALSLFSLSHPTARTYISDQIYDWNSSTRPDTKAESDAAPDHLSLPYAYDAPEHQSEFCEERFSTKYLETLRDHARSYCSDGSTSNLTCFHIHASKDYTDPQDRVDSLCFGRGAVLDVARGRYVLDCKLRPFDEATETAQGLIPFDRLKGYWYETGPQYVFERYVELDATPERLSAARHHPAAVPPPRFHLLLKREGEANPWHCLMEIYSTWMSFDALRMARDPLNGNRPFFEHPADTHDTHLVILDDRLDGPYWDLWQLFAERTPVRLKDLIAEHTAGNPSLGGAETNIIIPLAGASNPLWQNDWDIRDCTSAPTLHVFARRVLDFYRIEDPPRNPNQIVVTFVDCKESRRLRDQDALFAALREDIPHVNLSVVDFAAIPFAEQLRIIRDTDVLVGVHGAGLTHTMFMRERAGIVVEMQPETLRHPQTGEPHNGFRNLANMLRLDYFRIHVPQVSAKSGEETKAGKRDQDGRNVIEKRPGWHVDDVQVDKERFLEVMNMAIKSLYAKGIWNFDVN